MLAPGDYLTQPVPATPLPASAPTECIVKTTLLPQSVPVAPPVQTEPQSFLLTLLRILGTIHS